MARAVIVGVVGAGIVGFALGFAVTARPEGARLPGEPATARSTSDPTPRAADRARQAVSSEQPDPEPAVAPVADPGPGEAAERAPLPDAWVVLSAKLEELRAAGLVGDLDLAGFVTGPLLRAEGADKAFDLLMRLGLDDLALLRRIAGGGMGGARPPELYQRLYRADRQGRWARSLREASPALFLAELQRAISAGGEPTYRERLESARALRQLARDGEARDVALELLEDAPHTGEVMALLRELDPDAAESRLHQLLGERPHEPKWVSSLAHLLAQRGEVGEAREMVLAALQSAGDPDAVDGLFEDLAAIAPVAALRWASVRDRRIEAGRWAELADALSETGRQDLAIDALCRALAVAADNPRDYLETLRESASERAIAQLEQRVAAGAGGEFHGALAEMYWRAGRSEEARAMWERARELDPSDDEWSQRLASIEAGADPLRP